MYSMWVYKLNITNNIVFYTESDIGFLPAESLQASGGAGWVWEPQQGREIVSFISAAAPR